MPGHVVTIWRARDGAPTDIGVLAQTADGWIWLGTSSGLYRFDGKRFYLFDLIPEAHDGGRLVTDMSVDSRGGLWVVYANSVAAHLAADGTIVVPPGLPPDRVGSVIERADGVAMVSAKGVLYELTAGRWSVVASSRWDAVEGAVRGAVVDDTRALVVITESGVYRLPWGTTQVSKLAVTATGDEDLFLAADGTLWRSDAMWLLPLPAERVTARAPARASSTTVWVDAAGGLWSLAAGCSNLCYRPRGLITSDRSMADAGVARFPEAPDGLLGMSLLVDASGSVWLGGKEGLARMRPTAVNTVPHDGGAVYFAVAPLGDGRMLVGTDAHGGTDRLWRYGADGAPNASPGVLPVTAMAAEEGDSVLLGGHGTLARYQAGALARLPLPPVAGDDLVQQIVPVSGGRFWASMRGQGLFLVEGNHWIRNGNLAGMPGTWPQVGASDGAGGAYFGYADGALVHVSDRASVLGGERGTGLGTVTAILPGHALLAGGERGVAWFDGQRFHALRLRFDNMLRGVTGLARARNGDLWINARAGLVRVRASAIHAMELGDDTPLPFDLISDADGLPGGAQQTRPLPTISASGTGALWVAANAGLVTVDDAIKRPVVHVQPAILSLASGARVLSAKGGTLEPSESTLSVAYTGLSLEDPQHIQLRYRLNGADETWRTADGPGDVQYAHLAPGTYRFEIQARGTNGDWSAVVSSGSIVRQPSTVETVWFRLLILTILLLLMLGGVALRVRAIHRRANERAAARLAERDRIARDLHDSMLQGMLGVALRMEAWCDDERLPGWIRPGLGQTTQRLLALLQEGRARVIALRSVGEGRLALSEALRLIGEDHVSTWPAKFSVSVSGEERELDETTHMAVIDILREAVHNAFVHAEPASVAVTLDYAEGGLVALVDDDGKGLPTEVRDAGKRPGHWGLVTMRERAERIGAEFSVVSDAIGTSVTLIVRPEKPGRRRWFR